MKKTLKIPATLGTARDGQPWVGGVFQLAAFVDKFKSTNGNKAWNLTFLPKEGDGIYFPLTINPERTEMALQGNLKLVLTKDGTWSLEMDTLPHGPPVAQLGPVAEFKDPALLARIRSTTNPGRIHEIRQDGWNLSCTCPGYVVHSHCWHVDVVKCKRDEVQTGKP